MKRLVVLLTVCCVILGGCGNGSVSQEEYDRVIAERDEYKEKYEQTKEDDEQPTEEDTDSGIDYADFENATLNYENFNSNAEDTDLYGTKIFIEGVAQERIQVGDMVCFVLKQDDEKMWIVGLSADEEEDEKVIDQIIGERVKVFGIYVRYSDIHNMPAMSATNEDGSGKIEKEISDGKFETVWTFMEYLLKVASEQPKEETSERTDEVKSVTIGEENALRTAKSYLSIMPFSYNGLIDQLEYEGYSYDEAVYAADNCGADWNAQAVKQAKSYLDIMAFSRQGLIEQLEYEGFTHEQAVYGAEQNGY